MSPSDHIDEPSPDRGPAPAYRLAPDTPAQIAAELARLCAPAASAPEPNGARDLAQGSATAAGTSPSRRLALFGVAAALFAPPLARPADAEDLLTIVSLIHRRIDASWVPPRV